MAFIAGIMNDLKNVFATPFQQDSDHIKQAAQQEIPLIANLSNGFPITWTELKNNQGRYTVPGTTDRVDLLGKRIQLEKITLESVQRACQYIQGGIICKYRAGDALSEDSYYKAPGCHNFTKFSPDERGANALKMLLNDPSAEDEPKQRQELKKLEEQPSTIVFTLLDRRLNGTFI